METVKFTLTETEADMVVKALAKLPYDVSAGLIGKLQQQYQEQVKENAQVK